MNDAYVEAIAAGAAYRETVLEPALVEAMKKAGEGEPFDARQRLGEVLAAFDEAGDKLCRLEYDLFAGGTMRTLVAGSCTIENSDDLIGSLIGLQHILGH